MTTCVQMRKTVNKTAEPRVQTENSEKRSKKGNKKRRQTREDGRGVRKK